MKKEYKTTSKGSLILVAMILIGVVLFFKIDLKSYFESEQTKKNIAYIETKFQDLWNTYSSKFGVINWNNLFTNTLSQSMKTSSNFIPTLPTPTATQTTTVNQ